MDILNFAPGIAAILFFLIFGRLWISRNPRYRETKKFQFNIFAIALILRFLMAIVIYQFGFVNVLGDADSAGWVYAGALSAKWQQDGMALLDLPNIIVEMYQSYHVGYYYFTGILFWITGIIDRLLAVSINCFAGAITVVLIYRIAFILFSKDVAKITALLCCFFPSLIIWSAQTVKEPLVVAFEALILYCIINLRLFHKQIFKYIIISIFSVIFLAAVRYYAAVVCTIVITVGIFMPSGKSTSQKGHLIKNIFLITLFIGIFFGTGIMSRYQTDTERLASLEALAEYREGIIRADAGSTVVLDYDITTPSGLIKMLIMGGFYLYFSPFPWQLGGASLRMLLVMPEVLFWWWLFIFAVIPGLIYSIKKKFGDIFAILLFVSTMSAPYALAFANIGLAHRMRGQLLPFLFIFAGVGLVLGKIKRQRRRQIAE